MKKKKLHIYEITLLFLVFEQLFDQIYFFTNLAQSRNCLRIYKSKKIITYYTHTQNKHKLNETD